MENTEGASNEKNSWRKETEEKMMRTIKKGGFLGEP
jgi:hypothetical protein